MGIFSKNKTIRALGKISILAFGLFMLAQPVMAAPEYRKVPDCGPNAIVDGQPTACTYSDKSTTTCIRTTTEEDGKTVRKYECTNADTSKTACTIIGSGIPECTVTELSGTTYDTNDGNVNGVKSFTDGLLGGALLGVSLFILTLASTLLGFIGSAFNWAVINTIFNFGSIFGTSESMIIAWGVLRDVGNIVLLFGFILMGVLTILNLHDYPVKKTIPGLIIFAVLLNFSLFASQVVIDVSNAFSSIFYEQASSQCENAENVRECVKNDNSGISGIIVEQAGLTSAFSIDEQNGANLTTLGRGIIYLGLALFVTVAAIVLLAATVMLVVRAVMLSFLMVVSPIGFAGMAIPPLKKLAQRWWSELLKQAFFAPIFLLLIFVSLKLTEGLSAGVNDPGKGLANALAGGSFGGMGIIVTFMVVIGFMMASLIAAKSVGAMGTDMAMKGAGTIAMGSAGFVGRRTLGAASAGLASAARSRPALTNNFAGRALISGLDKGAHSSFDLRNSKSFSTVAGAAGANFGAGSKKSWHGMEEEEIKKKEKFAKSLKLSAADEANIEESKKQVKDTELEMVTEQNNFKETQQKAQAAIKSEEESVANVLKPQAAQLKAAKQAAEAAKEKAEITGEAGDKQAAVRLTTSYNASLQQYEAEKEAAEEKVQALKDVAEQEKKVYEERRKMQQAYVDAHKENEKWMAKNPQRRFAASLEQSSITPFMVTGHANHEAAKNIIKDINASEIAKLTKQLEKAASGGGGGGGDHGHAAPAAPKPKPAASGGGGGDHGHDH